MPKRTYKHFGDLDGMAEKWTGMVKSFDEASNELERSVAEGERSWEEAFQILRFGCSGPISDQDLQKATAELIQLNIGSPL